MKAFFTTTAMILALGLPGMTQAQATDTGTTAGTADMGATPGFMAMRGMNTMLATDLIGREVYARRTPIAMVEPTSNADGTRGMAMIVGSELDTMDNVGQITDLVLSGDGTVAAVVIGIGGFLGVGERDVAITLDQVSFATRSDAGNDTLVVVNTNADMLKASPMFDRMRAAGSADGMMSTGATDGTVPAQGTERTMWNAPMIERDGYQRLEATDVSVDMNRPGFTGG